MTNQDFILKSYSNNLEKGSISVQSPSNIALVKYWGKYGEQLPKNASISFTLSNCHTKTILEYTPKKSKDFDFQVFLDGKREEDFEPKIKTFFERIHQYVPFLKDFSFIIKTTNSFPHSSGIASSASGMSALAMCLVELEKRLVSTSAAKESRLVTSLDKTRKASFIARLGSGSAARSIEGPLIVWGEHVKINGSSNLFGTKYPFSVHEVFKNYQDTILLVDKGEKQVSSTVGHGLMHNHPFATQRFEQANNNLAELIPILEKGDLDAFIAIVESEALSLHAMMLTSMPYFILMKPNTLAIINEIWSYRKKTDSKVCFTLDAGANVHVLYPESEKDPINSFIQETLCKYCKKNEFIQDYTGEGTILI